MSLFLKNALEKRDSHFHTEKNRIEYLGAHILRSKKESNPDKDKVKWWSTISHELWVLWTPLLCVSRVFQDWHFLWINLCQEESCTTTSNVSNACRYYMGKHFQNLHFQTIFLINRNIPGRQGRQCLSRCKYFLSIAAFWAKIWPQYEKYESCWVHFGLHHHQPLLCLAKPTAIL